MRIAVGPAFLRAAAVFIALPIVSSQITIAQAKHGSGYPQPPEPADRSITQVVPSTPPIQRPRLDALQVQREARELLELSQSLQPDIDLITHGMLPKDSLEKLKRIEKLAKHLRGEIAP